MLIKTIAFGKMWRYECDGDGCEARHTTIANGPMPDEWVFRVEDGLVLCPCCADLLTFPNEIIPR